MNNGFSNSAEDILKLALRISFTNIALKFYIGILRKTSTDYSVIVSIEKKFNNSQCFNKYYVAFLKFKAIFSTMQSTALYKDLF